MRRNLAVRIGALVLGLSLLAACTDDAAVPTGVAAAQAAVPTLAGIDLQNLGNSVVTLKARATDPQGGALAFLKRLKGGGKERTASAGARQMKMLKRIPQILRFIPGTAQDVRAYFLTLQYWLAGSDENMATSSALSSTAMPTAHAGACAAR